MKILSRGIHPDKLIWRGRCMKCLSHLECEQHELDEIIPDTIKREGPYGKAKCPVCQNTVTFSRYHHAQTTTKPDYYDPQFGR